MEEYEYFKVEKNKEASKGKKTDVYDIINSNSGGRLGQVRWYSEWRRYCFFPDSDTVFSKGCLEDVNTFINQLMEDRKE